MKSLSAAYVVRPVLATALAWSAVALANAQEPATDAAAAAATDAADDAAPADHYAVPVDASIDELLKFVSQVRRPAAPIKSREEMMEHFRKVAGAIDEATKQVLAAKPDDRQTFVAIREQAGALRMLEQMGQAEASERLQKLIAESVDHKLPEVRAFARGMRLQSMIARWGDLDQAARDGVVGELNDSFANEKLDPGHLRNLMMFVDGADMAGDTDTAISVLEAALPRFAQAEDSTIAERLPTLEGVLNRLRLPGNKLELAGTMVDGSDLDWEAYRGKVVLVDFWATWCGPCRAELPNVLKQVDAYGDKGFTVLGVSLDTDKAVVEEFVTKQALPWASMFSHEEETAGWSHPMAVKYGINAIPRAILVDQQGIVVHMNARGEQLAAQLEKLLGPPAAETTDASKAADDTQTASVEPE